MDTVPVRNGTFESHDLDLLDLRPAAAELEPAKGILALRRPERAGLALPGSRGT